MLEISVAIKKNAIRIEHVQTERVENLKIKNVYLCIPRPLAKTGPFRSEITEQKYFESPFE